MYKYGNDSEKSQDALIKYWLLQPVLFSSLATLLVTTHHLTAAGNTCDGDLLFSISSDSWRQLTWVESAVDSPRSLIMSSRCTECRNFKKASERCCSNWLLRLYNSTVKENIPQISLNPIFQALVYAHALPQSAPVHVHLPRIPEVGLGLKKDL